jgi:hypothetical protein
LTEKKGNTFRDCITNVHSLIDAGAPLRISRDGDLSEHNLREIEEDWIRGVCVLWPINLPDPSELCLLNPSDFDMMVDDLSLGNETIVHGYLGSRLSVGGLCVFMSV